MVEERVSQHRHHRSDRPTKLFEKFQKETGVSIIEGYGMTEATCLVSCNPPDGEHKIGSVGLPLPFTDVKILEINRKDEVVRECQFDEPGEICINNPGIVVGSTYTDPNKNISLFVDDKFLRTGDIGYMDADGYLWLTGRAKDVIMRGGHNIDPLIIEEALAGHPSISLAGAIGQPDIYSGELPCAYVELVSGSATSVGELMEYAQQNVSDKTACPKYIEILEELPKTAIGKVFKPDLRRLAIIRTFNDILVQNNINAKVNNVIEDKKLGLVAKLDKIDSETSDQQINNVLGQFIIPWQWN